MSLTCSPWVPFSSFFMCSCVLLPPGRFGPLRAEVVVGLRRARLVQALLSSPSSAGLVPCPSSLRFFFSLAFSGFARSGLGFMCWCFLLPSSFAFPSLRPGYVTFISLSSSPHFHFPSSSFSSHGRDLIFSPSCGRVCVCVNHL